VIVICMCFLHAGIQPVLCLSPGVEIFLNTRDIFWLLEGRFMQLRSYLKEKVAACLKNRKYSCGDPLH
jgi:hypothetical protein